MQRFGLGAFGLFLVDGAGLNHRIQHQVAPINGAVGMTKRIEVAGPLNNARKHGALGQIELTHIFAKIGLGCLAKSIN